MNVVYSHVQFYFRMNNIFKSEVGRKQELNGTKKNKNFLVQHWKWYANGHICSANGHICSECLRTFRLNGCVCSGITRFGRMCLFCEQIYLFGKVVPVPTKQMCLFRRVAPVTTERFSDSSIKGRISLQRNNQNNSEFIFLLLLSEYKVCSEKILFKIFVVFWSVSTFGQVKGTG